MITVINTVYHSRESGNWFNLANVLNASQGFYRS